MVNLRFNIKYARYCKEFFVMSRQENRALLVYILNGFTITPNCVLITLKVAFNC